MKDNKLHVKKNDQVKVIAGKEIGKTGKVLKVFPKSNRAVVEGLNFIRKAQRPTQRVQRGGIIEKEGTIHISNLMVICPRCNKASRIGRSQLQDGRRVRTCKGCGEVLEK